MSKKKVTDYSPEELEEILAKAAKVDKMRLYEKRYATRIKLERQRYSEGVEAGVIEAITDAEIDAAM